MLDKMSNFVIKYQEHLLFMDTQYNYIVPLPFRHIYLKVTSLQQFQHKGTFTEDNLHNDKMQYTTNVYVTHRTL